MDPESSWSIGSHFPCQSLGPYALEEENFSMVPSLALILGSAPLGGLFKVTEATLEERCLRLACCLSVLGRE